MNLLHLLLDFFLRNFVIFGVWSSQGWDLFFLILISDFWRLIQGVWFGDGLYSFSFFFVFIICRYTFFGRGRGRWLFLLNFLGIINCLSGGKDFIFWFFLSYIFFRNWSNKRVLNRLFLFQLILIVLCRLVNFFGMHWLDSLICFNCCWRGIGSCNTLCLFFSLSWRSRLRSLVDF